MSAMADIASGFILDKMRSTLAEPVEYDLVLDTGKISVNSLIGKKITLEYQGEMRCLHCADPKVFNQGYCFRCTQKLPQCDFCILSPEKCHFHLGTCRDEDFAQSHCFIPHVIYLSFSSHVKVGLTRKGNEMTRWIDQGALAAVPIMELKNRRAAGKAESTMKKWFSDRTSWQKMLKEREPDLDALIQARSRALEEIEKMGTHFLENEREREFKILDQETPTLIRYPVERHPEKVKSMDLKKLGSIEGRLMGIKGQYFVFQESVVNLRKYQGFRVKIGSEPKIS